ncbi:Integrase, catalytic core domain and Ribonuclease H-like domain-containing protein [Strongyloides ratti]|uniref:Integrase, catalytic core domain and Ribonuclease H-like domain-containing protein n=1 Tax=Strongyloides ratti TaxID=34506 RepID=A0A090MQY8_STRRB|nr:Integrase, catalytic core domain and Ribonuclease H-like domain-containing protein [Strongyloides ratti]CEF60588.1 Integrase, catalytic core domain and Ribonuclease H-like domain-containing protein [Strongyloides ratti]
MNETNCKATNIAKEMFNKYHKSRSYMCYSKCRDEIIEALQERKLSKYVTVEILNKMIQYIKNLKEQSTELICAALKEIQKHLDHQIEVLRVDNFRSFTSSKILKQFPELKIETTILQEHTTNGVVERCIRSIRLWLSKEEEREKGRKSFERRLEVVTKHYNRSKHSSTGERPRDVIFAFSLNGEKMDEDEIRLRKLKMEIIQNVNNPVVYRKMNKGKPKNAMGILKSVNVEGDTVNIEEDNNHIIRRPILKIRTFNSKEGRS